MSSSPGACFSPLPAWAARGLRAPPRPCAFRHATVLATGPPQKPESTTRRTRLRSLIRAAARVGQRPGLTSRCWRPPRRAQLPQPPPPRAAPTLRATVTTGGRRGADGACAALTPRARSWTWRAC
eukprot:8548105-Ditylum_brightwellii.AAC.1